MYSMRFRLPPNFEANIPDHTIEAGNGELLSVSKNEYAIHLRSIERFSSIEEAENKLVETSRGLELLGVFLGYGIADFRKSAGDERAPSPVENLRIQILLDNEEVGIERALQVLNRVPEISKRYVFATEMYDDSYFVEDQKVALVLRTTGLELLSTRQAADQEKIDAIDHLAKCLADVEIEASTKSELINALGREKKESVSKAVRRHIGSIVPEADVRILKDVYSLRSRIVHGESVDRMQVNVAAANAATLLRYSILREVGFDLSAASFRS